MRILEHPRVPKTDYDPHGEANSLCNDLQMLCQISTVNSNVQSVPEAAGGKEVLHDFTPSKKRRLEQLSEELVCVIQIDIGIRGKLIDDFLLPK